MQFDSAGTFVRFIGSQGAGPGELLAPVRLAWSGDELTTYDRALGRLVVFDTAGSFVRSIQVQGSSTLIGDLVPVAAGRFLVSLPVGSHTPIALVDSAGKLASTVLQDVPMSLRTTAGPPGAGRLCMWGQDSVAYANPWIHEITLLSADGRNVFGVWRRPSALLRPVAEAGSGPGMKQNALLLGLACGGSHLVLAYLDAAREHVYYEVLGKDGTGLAQLTFSTVSDSLHPGFLADMKGNSLLTYRGNPFPRVMVFSLSVNPR